ncbi:hypothetical protein [Actinoplanes sp. NBRC 101535]|uniref:hypothetical protein n=1 Tax=Actinoplanes sp. NBRC 101535 TaxID=3032196 RepID=UPI00249FA405|nr:hypothetical protein [Actinoplanes sp. NBRC 101535]GLY02830.1 hypothetical protein Acsp01_32090 [Actinoplanes sp. NBRC 101535]
MTSFPPASTDRVGRPGAAAVAAVMTGSAVMIAITALAWWSDRTPSPLLVLDLVTALLALLLAPLTLWRPAATTAVSTVLAALSPVATSQATIGALQVAWRRRFPAAAATGTADLGLAGWDHRSGEDALVRTVRWARRPRRVYAMSGQLAGRLRMRLLRVLLRPVGWAVGGVDLGKKVTSGTIGWDGIGPILFRCFWR